MKRIIAAVVLALIVAALCTADIIITDRIYDKLTDDIAKCRTAFESGDYLTAENYSKKLESNWTEWEGMFSLFTNHDLIDDIGVSVSKLEPLAKDKDNIFLVECRIIEMTLTHIKNDSRVNLHSIF